MEEKNEVPQFIRDGVDHLLERTKQKILTGFSKLEVEEQLRQLSLIVQLSEVFRGKLDKITKQIESGELDQIQDTPPAKVEDITPKAESAENAPASQAELALRLISKSKISGEIFKEVITFIARSRKMTMNELAASIPVSNSYLYTFFAKDASFSTGKGRELVKWAREQVKEINKSK